MTCAGKMQDVCRENAGRVPEHAGCVPGTYQKCAGICRVYAGRACADQLFLYVLLTFAAFILIM